MIPAPTITTFFVVRLGEGLEFPFAKGFLCKVNAMCIEKQIYRCCLSDVLRR